MKRSSVIITAENKEGTVLKTIQSCLDQNLKDLEIFVVYTNLNNKHFLKKKIKSSKVFFIKTKKIRNNIHDQLFKIKTILKKTTSKEIFLLDGDDFFKKDKIRITNRIFLNTNKKMILNNHVILNQNKILKNSNKYFEKNYIYRYLINSWPKNICTSSISIKKDLLIRFFNDVNYSDYKHLAIDALLTLYCKHKKQIFFEKKILTIKKDEKKSVDKKFLGLLNFFFWERRYEQHRFNNSLNKFFYFNLDYFFTSIVYGFYRLLSKIFSILRK